MVDLCLRVWVSQLLFDDVVEWFGQYFDLDMIVEVICYMLLQLVVWLVGVDGVLIIFNECIGVVEIVNVLWLCVIVNVGVGYNNLDVDVFSVVGILVSNILDVLIEIIVDFGFVMLMVVVCCIIEFECWLCEGQWGQWLFWIMFGVDIYGSMLGIFGMGCIGQGIVCCGVLGFGMCVLYYNWLCLLEVIEIEVGVMYVDLDMLLVQVDYLVLVLLYSVVLYYIIDVVVLVKMKLGVILVNIVCGGIVDELVLVDVLVNGCLVVVGLDVFDGEFMVCLELLVLCNVVFILYIGSVSQVMCWVMVQLVVDNLMVVLDKGFYVGCLLSVINVDVVYVVCVGVVFVGVKKIDDVK